MRRLVVLALLALAVPALAQTAAPKGLQVETPAHPDGCTSLVLRWDPVPGAFGYEVLQYEGGRWVLDENDAAFTPMTASTTLSGLEPGMPYEFKVRAVGPEGASEPSEPVGGRTLARDAASPAPAPSPKATAARSTGTDVDAPPPDPPSGLIGVFSDSDRVQLAWRKVPGAVSYRIQEQKDGQWIELNMEGGPLRENKVTLLDHPRPGPFRFRVFAVGANGRSSEPSFSITVVRD